MNAIKNILAIYIDQYSVYCSVFNGKLISLITPFRDSFTLKSTGEFLKFFDPSLILIDTFIGFGPILTKENIKKFKNVTVNKKNRIFKNLSKGENRCLEILSSYFKTKDKAYVDHYKILGYIESYFIERINWNSFYIDSCEKLIFGNSKKIKTLYSNLKTKYGKILMNKWLFQPLKSTSHINQRRNLIEFIIEKIAKRDKYLKRCRDIKIDKDLDIKKLKIFLKSTFQLEELLENRLKLCNKSKYFKLFKVLKSYESRFLSADLETDSIDWKWIDTIAKSISNKYRIPLSITYFPEIGFLIESNFIIENAVFKIKDKFYSKNKDMIDLDNQIKDNYEEKNKIKSKLLVNIISKIRKVKFFHIYEFIGEIDALFSIAVANSEFLFEDKESNIFQFLETNITNKNIILGDFSGYLIAELIILNQIGCKLSNSNTILPIYNKIGYKSEFASICQIKNSLFQEEIIKTGNIFRESNSETLCIIENPFQTTNVIDSVSLFSKFIRKIQVKHLIISTKIESSQIEGLIKEINAQIIVVNQNNIIFSVSIDNMYDQKNDRKMLTDISKFLLFNNKLLDK